MKDLQALTPPDLPLDRSLNAAILHMAGRLFPTGFDVSADAPGSYEALCDHLNRTGRMVVYNGGSGRTIYADDEVNYAMRAWHDWAHWRHGHPFTVAGEAANCAVQIGQLYALWGDCAAVRRWAPILEAEIIGQRVYHKVWGEYVGDQMAFVRAYLVNPSQALSRRF